MSDIAPEGTEKRPLLVFLNEIAGGRKLLEAVRERTAQGHVSEVIVAAPQNQPTIGTRVRRDDLHASARARVEVTMSVFAAFGIDSVGEVLDPAPQLALDDAIRANRPREVLFSALSETRFGIARKDLVEVAREIAEPEVKFTHIPVRVEEDAIRLDLSHVLVVATKTVNAPDLVSRLKERAASRPHRYTIICPRSEDVAEEQVVRDLAATLAELYRAEVDATGLPISSDDPFEAVRNAIEHYRIDEILISTFAGEQSRWLQSDLIGRVREITDKPVSHVESGRAPAAFASVVAEGGEH
ncbi:MAG TPA: hypothetical protein VHZ54_20160 [Solirubrobacterales bacterium]|nr:hypothetical protein [Solirubrobacterales bacterium]